MSDTLADRWLLAIPVHNEQQHVLAVLEQARRQPCDVLVVDDGSTDGTPALLASQRDLVVVGHEENRGYGASLATAFRHAQSTAAAGRRYDWLITMDCDEQHEADFVPRFMHAAQTSAFDIISGSRYLRSFRRQDTPPADRRAINARVTAMVNRRLGLNLTDAFCGFKAYRVAALAALDITEPGYAMPMQFWVQAAAAGLRITELPVRLIYNDPTRHFGGNLDDPVSRFAHYVDVFERESARASRTSAPVGFPSSGLGTRACGAGGLGATGCGAAPS